MVRVICLKEGGANEDNTGHIVVRVIWFLQQFQDQKCAPLIHRKGSDQ